MRPELEETKYIEYYLLNKLSEEEKSKFELRIKNDSEFAEKVKMQELLIKRVGIISIKQSISQAHRSFLQRQKFSFSNKTFKYSFNTIITIISVVIVSYLALEINTPKAKTTFIKIETGIFTPIKGIDVPYITDTIIAENGAVINYNSGSSVIIPSNVFIDENGDTITGKVEVKFREFKDATDIYIAGIPMNYEIDNEEFVLESASMCEIKAFKNGKAVKIKPGKNIEIMQSSYTSSNLFNLYRLNKKNRKWIKKGKDIPLAIYNEEVKKITIVKNPEPNIVIPAKPLDANNFKYSLTVNFSNDEFPELSVYKDVEFGIDLNDTSYRLSHADVLWESVYLKKGPKTGSFIITFSKGKRKVSYLVYPIFRDENYKNAMRTYNKNIEQYDKIRNSRIKNEKKESNQQILAKQKQDSLYKQISARNEEIKLYNKWFETDEARLLYEKWNNIMFSQIVEIKIKDKLSKMEKNKEFILSKSKLIDKTYEDLNIAEEIFRKRNILISQIKDNELINKLIKINSEMKDLISNKDFIETSYSKFEKEKLNKLAINNKIQRIYKIDEFGIWNCDQPTRFPNSMKIIANFSLNNEKLPLASINLVDKNIRSIYTYPSNNFKSFTYNKKSKNVIWAVINDGKLIYFNEFDSISENKKGKAYTFNMKEVKEPLTDYEKVREIIKNL
ncbi:MAG: hypothetical protein JXR51_15010 [Bacteroidales bacterium]|nr:hypothetical protein [Bacteroidales bacterium]MBN2758481.1 hypothetical protein [Bacteroidales bacterium]